MAVGLSASMALRDLENVKRREMSKRVEKFLSILRLGNVN